MGVGTITRVTGSLTRPNETFNVSEINRGVIDEVFSQAYYSLDESLLYVYANNLTVEDIAEMWMGEYDFTYSVSDRYGKLYALVDIQLIPVPDIPFNTIIILPDRIDLPHLFFKKSINL